MSCGLIQSDCRPLITTAVAAGLFVAGSLTGLLACGCAGRSRTATTGAAANTPPSSSPVQLAGMVLTVTAQYPRPVIDRSSPGTEGNKYGFEGGRALKLGDTYHLFVSEMIADVRWAKTRLAHWTSTDRVHWTRQSTLFESSGDYTGKDPRAALFLPQPVFNEAEGCWNLFYAAFRCAPNTGGRWMLNYDGRIWRAVSQVSGIDGIGGPYVDAGVVLEPGKDSDPWEGLQGTDSSFPYRVGERWYAFYGSAHTQKWPCDFWGVGLATAPRLAGPWKRCSELNPVLIDKRWVENPVVTRMADGTYAAVFDATPQGLAIGYTSSQDGVHWATGQYLRLDAGEGQWLKQPRTPLGLIPREDGNFDLFFTGTDRSGYGAIGWLTVRRDGREIAPAGAMLPAGRARRN